MFARIVTSCKSQIFFERMSPNSMPLSIISSDSSLIRIIRNNSRFYLSGSPTREKRHSVIKHGCLLNRRDRAITGHQVHRSLHRFYALDSASLFLSASFSSRACPSRGIPPCRASATFAS